MTTYEKIELLRLIEEYFVKDFDFSDISNSEAKEVFSEDEMENILNELSRSQDKSSHISLMFFILIYREDRLEHFMNSIAAEYDWLTNKWRELKLMERNTTIDVYREAILYSEIPKNRDLLVHRFEYLWTVQQKLKSLRRGEYLALIGNLGFGKRWIATDACYDLAVMRKMNYNIFWLNVNKCKTSELILEQLVKLKIMINFEELSTTTNNNYDHKTNNEIFFVKKQIRKILDSDKYKECLLVLSGVQNIETLKAFESLNCKILLTARSVDIMKNISTKLKTIITISNGFTPDESRKLFSIALDKPKLNEEEKQNISALHRLCKGHPFIMNLIAVNLMHFGYEYPNERWNTWLDTLKKYKLNNDEINYPIKQTLNDLTNDQQSLFKSLVIFTDNVNIPISVLERYWNKTANETEEIIKLFVKASLLETVKVDGHKLVCSMHYVYYTYLTNLEELNSHTKCTMHKKLIDSYRIMEALNNRTEPDIVQLPKDNYFYFYVGHHLKESKNFELFPLLFLDLGFLEQKLRATQLPNTIGDLELYKREIIGSGSESNKRRQLLDDLLEFLPNIEEMMCKSSDTCLLQYALNFSVTLRNEALEQAKKFKNRIWMRDLDHSQNQRQIVQLPKNAQIIKLYDDNTAIVALSNSTILLKDLSSIYSVESTNYIGHKTTIIQIEKLNDEHFLSLDKNGYCKLWSVKDTPIERRRRDNEEARVLQREFKYFHQTNPFHSTPIQEISNTNSKITSFYKNLKVDNNIEIFFGTQTGRVLIYSYNRYNSLLEKSIELKTEFKSITHLIPIFNNYLLVLNNQGDMSMFCLGDNGNVAFYGNDRLKYNNFLNLHLVVNTLSSKHFLMVYKNNITSVTFIKNVQIKLMEVNYENLTGTLETFNDIICSQITTDKNYLIFGTKSGAIIYDVLKRTDILRISISESIRSLDIVDLDDSYIYKYLLLTCTEKSHKIINIYGLINEINELSLCEGKQLNSAYLLGGKLFDFVYDNKTNEIILYAVDSKKNVHEKLSNSKYSKSSRTVPFNKNITAISSSTERILIGLEDGSIYNLFTNNTIDIDSQDGIIDKLDSSIIYLKCYDNNISVAGTSKSYKILSHSKIFDGVIVDVFRLETDYLIIVKTNCSFDVVRIVDNERVISHVDLGSYDLCRSSSLIDNYLLLGTDTSRVNIYEIDLLEFCTNSVFGDLRTLTISPITSVSLSPDKSLFAIGFKNGIIEVYDINSKYLYRKRLHTKDSPIMDLKFSPWTSINSPLILISLSDRVCFWNLNYENENSTKLLFDSSGNVIRRSQRFKNRKSMDNSFSSLNINASDKNSNENLNSNGISTINQWKGKIGASDNPVLLACIKLVGNSAEKIYVSNDFTKFLTIDDEGHIYSLRLLNLDNYNDRDKHDTKQNS